LREGDITKVLMVAKRNIEKDSKKTNEQSNWLDLVSFQFEKDEMKGWLRVEITNYFQLINFARKR